MPSWQQHWSLHLMILPLHEGANYRIEVWQLISCHQTIATRSPYSDCLSWKSNRIARPPLRFSDFLYKKAWQHRVWKAHTWIYCSDPWQSRGNQTISLLDREPNQQPRYSSLVWMERSCSFSWQYERLESSETIHHHRQHRLRRIVLFSRRQSPLHTALLREVDPILK